MTKAVNVGLAVRDVRSLQEATTGSMLYPLYCGAVMIEL